MSGKGANRVKVHLRVRPRIEREDAVEETFDFLGDNKGGVAIHKCFH